MADAQHHSGAPLWGISAEFDTPEALLSAIQMLKPRDYGRIDAFSPVPVRGAAEALGLHTRPIYPFALGGAVIGAVLMYSMCVYATIWGYRFNIGGRPLFSWPSYVVPSLSFGSLVGGVVAFSLLLLMSRLPRLNHPAFNIPGFSRASANRFFVAVEAADHTFDVDAIEAALFALPAQPSAVRRVPR